MEEQDDAVKQLTNENWEKVVDAVMAKDSSSHKLINVIEESKMTKEHNARVNQAFTYGIKLKNGQPEPRRLYENLTKLVTTRKQLGLTKQESLERLNSWKESQHRLEKNK